MDPEIRQAMLKLLKSPKQYAIDGESITMQSASDLIALAKKLEEDEVKDPLKRCRLFKVNTHGPAR